MEQLFELHRLDAQHRRAAIDELLLRHLDRRADRGLCGAFAVARLEHEELAALDGEFEVLHVAEMALQPRRDFHQLAIRDGKTLFQRGVLRAALVFADVAAPGPFAPGGEADLTRRANSSDHVLALRVGQKLAIDALCAGGRIAREGDAGCAIGAKVAEDHRLHGDGSAPVARDVIQLAVGHCAIVVPRLEHRPDRRPQLLPWILRHVLSGAGADEITEFADQFLEIVGGKVDVLDNTAQRLLAIDQLFERIGIVFVLGLQLQHDVAVHLAEAPVGVPCEARVLTRRFESLDGLVCESEVEHRVHHPGHRDARARADRDQ